MSDKPQPLNPVWKAIKPFVNGGLSGMAATCIIQPVDMVKVRLQLGDKGSPVSVAGGLGPGILAGSAPAIWAAPPRAGSGWGPRVWGGRAAAACQVPLTTGPCRARHQ